MILIAALAAAAGVVAQAQPTPLAVISAPPPPLTASGPACISAYAERAGQLRQYALTHGRIAYEQVIASAYPAGTITAEVLAAKATWRASLAKRGSFVVLADYRLARSPATVEVLNATSDPLLKSTLVAQYEAIHHWIGIAPAASDFCIYHEAGHSLQRSALQARGCGEGPWAASHAPHDPIEMMLQSEGADATSLARLRYLTSQDEFEVRLQDLNRFHALCVADGPILSPLDGLRALTALGVSVSFEDASWAFAAGSEALARTEYVAIVTATPRVEAGSTRMFEDAGELRLLRRLALRIHPEGWRWILAKILFEAPGHI